MDSSTLLVSTIIRFGQFVDDDDEIGKRLMLAFFGLVEQRERLLLLKGAVVLIDVADPPLGEKLEAAFPFRAWRCAERWEATFGSVTTGAMRCGMPS